MPLFPQLFTQPIDHDLCRAAGVKGLIFMTDEARVGPSQDIIKHLPAGTVVIFRDYDALDRAALATDVQQACRQSKCPFFIAGDLDLAKALGADGIHLPEWMLATMAPDDLKGLRVTAACHSPQSLLAAHNLDVDMMLISPIFQTDSHPNAKTLGIAGFINMIRASTIPMTGLNGKIAALGGINPQTAKQLQNLTALGVTLGAVAAISGLINK